ncbi:MAG: HEAT repeat domain-containing protein [Elusimicrobia bacterium]|nr:HEAT repeat domain-containing protein [Elusimicrobiota bacterium]
MMTSIADSLQPKHLPGAHLLAPALLILISVPGMCGTLIIDDIVNPNEEIRTAAIAELEKSTEAAIPRLVEGLQSKNTLLRSRIVRLLEDYRAYSAADDLARAAIAEPDWRVRNAILVALGRLRASGTAPTLLKLANEDERVANRVQAVTSLSRVLRKQSIPQMRLLLADKQPLVQLVAARELGRNGDAAGLDLAHRYLTASDRDVRTSAAETLQLIGRPESLPHLRKLLEDSREDRKSQASAWSAVNHIELIQMSSEKRLLRLREMIRSKSAFERSWAARELIQWGTPTAIQILTGLATQPSETGNSEARFALEYYADITP